jgi:sugar (pentulose or hexulose) kinase
VKACRPIFSSVFTSIKADVLGLTAQCYRTGDTALAGSAVIAGYGAGVFSDYRAVIRKTIQEEAPIRFNEENHRHYRKMIKKYLAVIDTQAALDGIV